MFTGLIEAVGEITGSTPAPGGARLTCRTALARELQLGDSIAVDGISLTVAGLDAAHFDVQVVPYTIEHTSLQAARVGDPVNLETDIIGKYVVRSRQFELSRSGE